EGSVTGVAAEDIGDFSLTHFKNAGQLLRGGLPLVLLFKRDIRLIYLTISTDLVLRKAHETTLLCKRLKDGLTDPPNRVGNKFNTLGFIKALGCFNQTQVAFVNQVAERKPLMLILFGN